MLKQKYFLTGIFILSAERQPIKLAWRKIVWLQAAYLLMRVLKELCSGIKVILADGGYRGELIQNVKNKFGYVIQVVISAYKEQGFKPIHKRWIVERTFSWMENDRRLCRNYELTFDSAEEMVKISAIKLLLKKI